MNLDISASDNYINSVVLSHSPNVTYDVIQIGNELNIHILSWANGHEYELKLSGSLAKGTGITGTTDIDYFISLNPSVSTCNTLQQVYTTLKNRFNGAGYSVREQNVSIGINHSGYKIDLVAGVEQSLNSADHSIWKRKPGTWTKTNIDEHISYVANSGRISDIKALKIWRKLWSLDFPSFYLELSVIEALSGKSYSRSPSQNFIDIMTYLANDFEDKVILDPSNLGNEVSEELTQVEKAKIKNEAASSLTSIYLTGNLSPVIW